MVVVLPRVLRNPPLFRLAIDQHQENRPAKKAASGLDRRLRSWLISVSLLPS